MRRTKAALICRRTKKKVSFQALCRTHTPGQLPTLAKVCFLAAHPPRSTCSGIRGHRQVPNNFVCCRYKMPRVVGEGAE